MTQAIYDYFPAETKLTRPKGGFILWLELPEQFDSLVLHEEALAQNIQIAPGVIFLPAGNYRNCLFIQPNIKTNVYWNDQISISSGN